MSNFRKADTFIGQTEWKDATALVQNWTQFSTKSCELPTEDLRELVQLITRALLKAKNN